MRWNYHDGGAAEDGMTDRASCVPRAIAIATGERYRDVYDQLAERQRAWVREFHVEHPGWPRAGCYTAVYAPMLADRGWSRREAPGPGATHVDRVVAESGVGPVLVRFRGHLSCVIDGVAWDTGNPSPDGRRPVRSWWVLKEPY